MGPSNPIVCKFSTTIEPGALGRSDAPTTATDLGASSFSIENGVTRLLPQSNDRHSFSTVTSWAWQHSEALFERFQIGLIAFCSAGCQCGRLMQVGNSTL